MDMKITGLPIETIGEAINQALPARTHILGKMLEAIETPKENLSPHAPRLLSFRIDPELIGTVIGPGGRTIKGITERTNTKIDIEDGGIVTIASHDGAAAEQRVPALVGGGVPMGLRPPPLARQASRQEWSRGRRYHCLPKAVEEEGSSPLLLLFLRSLRDLVAVSTCHG